MDFKFNGRNYEAALRIKDLKDLGFVPSKYEDNAEKLARIVASLKGGDVFTLAKVLEVILGSTGLKKSDIEDGLAKADDIDSLFDQSIDFFEKSPLTRRMTAMFMPTIDKTFKEMKQQLK